MGEEALDLAPIQLFRDLALEQYVGQMRAEGLTNGKIPEVIAVLDVLIDEVERLQNMETQQGK
jgi:hypothetical protein